MTPKGQLPCPKRAAINPHNKVNEFTRTMSSFRSFWTRLVWCLMRTTYLAHLHPPAWICHPIIIFQEEYNLLNSWLDGFHQPLVNSSLSGIFWLGLRLTKFPTTRTWILMCILQPVNKQLYEAREPRARLHHATNLVTCLWSTFKIISTATRTHVLRNRMAGACEQDVGVCKRHCTLQTRTVYFIILNLGLINNAINWYIGYTCYDMCMHCSVEGQDNSVINSKGLIHAIIQAFK
jgi:hypothetical protein